VGGTAGSTDGWISVHGGTATIVTTARVEAFPKNFNSFNHSNRNGLTNASGLVNTISDPCRGRSYVIPRVDAGDLGSGMFIPI